MAALSTFAVPSAKAGYWYCALVNDQSVAGTPDQTYKQDTAGSVAMGSCHNASKFGFTAYPDSQSSGKFLFIVNENNTIFRSATTSIVRPSTATPPGSMSTTYNEWPTDTNLKSYWSKLD
jgi:hypothetical protein